jgi:hypothetical protein
MITCLAAVTVIVGAGALAAAADDSGLAYSHDLRREGGRKCFLDHYHYGSGSGPSRAAAQKDAIASWVGFTDFEYGSDWAHYGRAASKRISCSSSGSGFECQIEARPCK